MTTPPPLLIASCPGRTITALRSELHQAAGAGADVGEVRLDRIHPDERARLSEIFPAPVPLMVTLRSRAEGGEGPDSSNDRTRLLESAAQLPFRFIDLERARDEKLIAATGPTREEKVTVVLSSHLPESSSTGEIRRLLELPRPPGAVTKIVLPCAFERLWSDLLPGLSPFDAYVPFILHTTGPTGAILRAWAYRLGMFGVYGSLPHSRFETPAETVEAAQLPVDRLRTYMRGGTAGPLFGVVGHPIQHSRSPDIHSFWFEREQRNALYVALDMASARDLAESLTPLATGGFKGLNVTHPWKQVALSLASRASSASETAACANTLSLDPDTISAENTDVAAVRRRLTELKEAGRWDDSPVVVLGAGGAARAALAAAASLGTHGIVIARRHDVAEELAREFNGRVGEVGGLTPARVVIHATPAGRDGFPGLDLPWKDVVGGSTHVLDFVYKPAFPFIREVASARGATYEDGSRLLVYQAAESYATWWGSAPSSALQTEVLREVLCTA
jgi:shikimate dehydrogenase/3-dehydroquinate dehydratase type I